LIYLEVLLKWAKLEVYNPDRSHWFMNLIGIQVTTNARYSWNNDNYWKGRFYEYT